MAFVHTRRRVLRGLGASLVAAPFLRGLLRPAQAAPAAGPKRLLVMFSPNGTVHSRWRPTGSERTFSFPAGSVLEPLTDWRDQLILLDRLDFFDADNHEGGMAAMLTGNGDASSVTKGASLDQVIAGAIGGGYRFPSIELGVQTSAWGGSSQTRMSYAGPGSYVTPDDDPLNVYTRLYGDVLGDAEAAAQRLTRQQSVLDLLMGEVSALQDVIGGEERVKLDAHLESLRALERSLSPSESCEAPLPPSVTSSQSNDSFPDVTAAQVKLAVAALACGASPVVSLQMSHTVSPTVFTWLGMSESHHSLSHIDDSNQAGVDEFIHCERWFAEQVGEALTQLAALPDPDGDGTMLDTTLVLWVKELGDGRLHTCESVPWVMTGGGLFTPGRWLDATGFTQHQALVSIAQAFGLDLDTFGDPSGGAGPMGIL